jgi:hypothetical protein
MRWLWRRGARFGFENGHEPLMFPVVPIEGENRGRARVAWAAAGPSPRSISARIVGARGWRAKEEMMPCASTAEPVGRRRDHRFVNNIQSVDRRVESYWTPASLPEIVYIVQEAERQRTTTS